MIREVLFGIVCVVAIIVMLMSAANASGIRCKGRIIDTGSLQYHVSKYCGQPEYIETVAGPNGTIAKTILVYVQNGAEYIVTVTDGRVKSVEMNRS